MENLEKLFKKAMYTSIGLLSVTKDKIKDTVDDLVSNEKISVKEGEKIMKDFWEKSESKKDKIEEDIKKSFDKLANKFDYAKSDEVDKLKARIEELEKLLDKKTPKPKTKAKAKTPPKDDK